VRFPDVSVTAAWSVLTVIASNPFGEQTRADYGFTRLDYPARTCIVVDKSDYRLYWIRDDILVKTYPIAIGKRRTQTPIGFWIVGRKEYMPPSGVYGPRRLKLARAYTYRRHGRRYTRYRMTGYGIHGTNQPWVIGTMASHGCIRLTNDQILDLWPQVPLNTVVQTRQ
jgi:lipoprotein-anchoring transpeptidase ErfK/SrfK